MNDALTFTSCEDKQKNLINLFRGCGTPESKYLKIIELGRALPPFPAEHMLPANIVHGCQSTLYLHTHTENDGKIYFNVASEALISAGLAALLIAIYNGEPPEAVLKCPPRCLEKLGIAATLTPGRSNGLASMYLRMQREALKLFVTTKI